MRKLNNKKSLPQTESGIAANNAQAEVAPLRELSATLTSIKDEGGSEALQAYLRNMKVPMLERARRIVHVSDDLVDVK